ncbi:MAG: hypothetical protein ABJP82_21060 [Hyphomicrobiales bacterium]
MHILVFASLSLALTFYVASDPVRTKSLITPVVEDAIELHEMAVASYRVVSKIDLVTSAREATRLYVSALQMPSMLFDRLAENLEQVNRSMGIANGPAAVSSNGPKSSPRDVLMSLKRL